MSANQDFSDENFHSSLSAAEPSSDQLEQRKADHIRINIDQDVAFKRVKTGLDDYFFLHEALPEIDFAQIITETELLGKRLAAPILISSMTGGTAEAWEINRNLALAAQEVGMAMGLGSVRAAIEDPELVKTFQVRDVAPDILLFANLGAVQLNYGYGLDECARAVELCQADALILHFNALQEAVQPEGDGDFSALLSKVNAICRALPVPVIAKEVGWGFSESTARRLYSAGISVIDVAGAGGTSWSQVEMYRAPTPRHARVAGAFIDWGIPTADAILNCRRAAPGIPVIASGGIKNGIDVAKAIALGATVAGMAGDFLRAAVKDGAEGVVEVAGATIDELRVAMFCTGVADLQVLAKTPLYRHRNSHSVEKVRLEKGKKLE